MSGLNSGSLQGSLSVLGYQPSTDDLRGLTRLLYGNLENNPFVRGAIAEVCRSDGGLRRLTYQTIAQLVQREGVRAYLPQQIQHPKTNKWQLERRTEQNTHVPFLRRLYSLPAEIKNHIFDYLWDSYAVLPDLTGVSDLEGRRDTAATLLECMIGPSTVSRTTEALRGRLNRVAVTTNTPIFTLKRYIPHDRLRHTIFPILSLVCQQFRELAIEQLAYRFDFTFPTAKSMAHFINIFRPSELPLIKHCIYKGFLRPSEDLSDLAEVLHRFDKAGQKDVVELRLLYLPRGAGAPAVAPPAVITSLTLYGRALANGQANEQKRKRVLERWCQKWEDQLGAWTMRKFGHSSSEFDERMGRVPQRYDWL